MALDRRKFLRGILGGSAAAVATAAAVKLEYVPEIREAALDELTKLEKMPEDEHEELREAIRAMTEEDLGMRDGKIIVSAPSKVFNPNSRIWKSVAGEANAWADYLSDTHGVEKAHVLAACKRLARACDTDLKNAEVDSEQEIVVDLPQVTREWTDYYGKKQIEIAMGVEKKEILGHERIRVGFIGKEDDSPVNLIDAPGFDTIGAVERKKREIERLQSEVASLEAAA